ncbi:MAG: UDP-3-O-(3-hydroxymyristoyl)glucosamine N-acyltransferase [Bacteroidetes bacterium]|nr:UDP-3-O-(3-hydroxymyristoyl)glucosamine N-acyltransferase [Bacteroidota bacterium]
MNFTASQIAFIVNGKVEGDINASVNNFGKIEVAKQGEISFLSNPKYEEYLYTTNASIVLINESFVLKHPVTTTLIKVQDAYAAFAILLSKYQEIVAQSLVGIEQPSYISSSAIIGDKCYVAAFAYIGNNVKIGNNAKIFSGVVVGNNVVIGDNITLNAGVKIYNDCVIGNNVTIHSGTIIGSDGFGFAPMEDGSYKKIPQLGNVIIEDDVEIGSNATIDRATMGSTIIKKGAKLDNLIQVAHNVEIGVNTVIAAQTGISGSTKIGNSIICGGQVGIAGHLTIADGTKIGAQSGISKSILTAKSVNGTPLQDITASLRSQSVFKNLPALEKRIAELEKVIESLLVEK